MRTTALPFLLQQQQPLVLDAFNRIDDALRCKCTAHMDQVICRWSLALKTVKVYCTVRCNYCRYCHFTSIEPYICEWCNCCSLISQWKLYLNRLISHVVDRFFRHIRSVFCCSEFFNCYMCIFYLCLTIAVINWCEMMHHLLRIHALIICNAFDWIVVRCIHQNHLAKERVHGAC